MKAKLILLDNPIIVTDEEIKEGDKFFSICGNIFEYKNGYTPNDTNGGSNACKKIISTNKTIDYNGIDFGIVDVEKLAMDKYPIERGSSMWMPNREELSRQFKQEGFIEGFKASQQLNEKKFSESDIILFSGELIAMYRKGNIKDADDVQKLLKTYSTPKTFEVEIEETPTNIKIIKKL